MPSNVTLKSRLPQIAAEIRPRVSAAVKAGAALIEAEAKNRAPVDSGKLRDAIHVERSGAAEYEVIAGNDDVFYGHMVEHGTSRTAPRPFLVPALEARRDEVVSLVDRALKGL